MFRNASISAAAVLALASAGVAAHTQTPEAPTVRVQVADLDLGQASGAHAALRRIQVAAAEVCGGAPSPADLDRQADFKLCVEDAIVHAVAQLHSPMATAMSGQAAGPRG